MDDDHLAVPSDSDPLAKRLFPPSPDHPHKEQYSPEKAATKRDPLHDSRYQQYRSPKSRRRRKSGRFQSRIGFLGSVIFLLLCLAAVLITAKLNYSDWSTLTLDDISRFFSNEQLQTYSNKSASGYFYFHGKKFLGLLGALPLAVALGTTCAMFTCLFMFYDSDIPGNFPPTPVSPRKQPGRFFSKYPWHLGYTFVPVNFFVALFLALFYFRWNMGLPLV